MSKVLRRGTRYKVIMAFDGRCMQMHWIKVKGVVPNCTNQGYIRSESLGRVRSAESLHG
jgi:hypothetical protein